MPIRPVDLQVMIPKAVDVSRIQANEQHHNLAVSQNGAQSIEKQSEQDLKQVNRREELHKTLIRDDNERRGNKSNQKHQNQQKQPDKKEAKQSKTYEKKILGNTIDIRL